MIATLESIDLHTWISILIKTTTYATALVAAGSVLVSLSIRSFSTDMRRWLGRVAAMSATAAATFSVARLPVRASFLTGGSLDGALDPMMLNMVAESPLGTSIGIRLFGLALILAILLPVRGGRWVAAIGSVIVCASFAFRGHVLEPPRVLLGGLLTAHLLALAYWIGALAPLLRTAFREPPSIAGAAAQEFGEKAIWIVGALVAAGAAMLLLFGLSNLAAFETPYGQAIAFKILLFVGVLSLAAANKLRLTSALLHAKPNAANHLRRSVHVEAVLIAAILLTTAAFTTVSSPARDKAEQSRTNAATDRS
ncbi:MAG: CopD family protein [Pseudomonadota bacterium]